MVQNLEARVLLCDPNHKVLQGLVWKMHERFGYGGGPNPDSVLIMTAFNSFVHSGVEYTFVDDLKQIPKVVNRQSPPYYSLIVYETEEAKREGAAGVIADVRKIDFFLPQIVVGRGLNAPLAARCARAGALYFAETSDEFEEQISKIFQRPSRLPKLTVVKMGGSAFDFDRQNKGNYNLLAVCQALAQLHRQFEGHDERVANRMIGITGAGQHGDVTKDQKAKYSFVPGVAAQYPQAMAEDLQANLKSLKPFFGDRASILTTGAFYYITRSSTSKRIMLIGTAPHYVMARDGIPLQDSDTHTLALAEFYGAERIILIKRTDGIYDFDPYRGFVPDVAGNCANPAKWRNAQKNNKLHRKVSINQLLSGSISREGTGTDGRADGSSGHLMEESALVYWRDRCQSVKEILVVHVAPEEMYLKTANVDRTNGSTEYKHVVTRYPFWARKRSAITQALLEKSIRDAFNGIAHSRIVREYQETSPNI